MSIRYFLTCAVVLTWVGAGANVVDTMNTPDNIPTCIHPRIGAVASSADSAIVLRLVDKRQNYCGHAATRCTAIGSPKSVNVSPHIDTYYVNSLEGGVTVAFDAHTDTVVAVISHSIGERHRAMWGGARPDLYPFTHYSRSDTFMGRPVEAAFSHHSRYLWVPYYRRSYDINAQDPSALAVIDTRTNAIVRLMETGPLPKMIATSHNNDVVAVTHWGNNTVGLIDIRGNKPQAWHHDTVLVVDRVLPLNLPLDSIVDRDTGSGYALRGTVFTPDDAYLLVSCMGAGGGIAVLDVHQRRYLGRVTGMMGNVRHLLIHGPYLYLSVNKGGYVQRCLLADFLERARTLKGHGTTSFGEWQNAKVGAGARTIAISPSGRYLFAACNTVSQLYVVDTSTMQTVCSIPVDSYPVGLDVSADGSRLYVTSQGRKGYGGNALDIYEVTYAVPECPTPPADDATLTPDEDTTPDATEPDTPTQWPGRWWPIAAFAAIALAVIALLVVRRRKKRIENSEEQ